MAGLLLSADIWGGAGVLNPREQHPAIRFIESIRSMLFMSLDFP
jgi:hypothetical protein